MTWRRGWWEKEGLTILMKLGGRFGTVGKGHEIQLRGGLLLKGGKGKRELSI